MVGDALAFWQPRYANRKLSQEDAREITGNVAGFFEVLREWDRKERAEKQPIAEMPRPLLGFELKRRIISTSRA
jgi:hypothetical protein